MPVQRFRSFQDAEDALWERGDDPAHLRSVSWVWAVADELCPPRRRPGVRRYRSIADAQRAWDEDPRS